MHGIAIFLENYLQKVVDSGHYLWKIMPPSPRCVQRMKKNPSTFSVSWAPMVGVVGRKL